MSQHTQEVIKRAISQFENGDMKVGDIVFCVGAVQDVILLEVPSPEIIEYYHRHQVISGPKDKLRYRSLDGSFEGEDLIALFIKISKGRFFVDYEIKESVEESENLAFDFEYAARCEGFKVIKIRNDGRWVIRIFGDTQESVNCFKFLYKAGHEGSFIFLHNN